MRLIDADALPRHGNRGGVVHWKDIENAPTIDPVRRGRWLSTDTNTCECSVCHTCEPYMFSEFEWCPNCGAKMDGGEE